MKIRLAKIFFLNENSSSWVSEQRFAVCIGMSEEPVPQVQILVWWLNFFRFVFEFECFCSWCYQKFQALQGQTFYDCSSQFKTVLFPVIMSQFRGFMLPHFSKSLSRLYTLNSYEPFEAVTRLLIQSSLWADLYF